MAALTRLAAIVFSDLESALAEYIDSFFTCCTVLPALGHVSGSVGQNCHSSLKASAHRESASEASAEECELRMVALKSLCIDADLSLLLFDVLVEVVVALSSDVVRMEKVLRRLQTSSTAVSG